MESFDQSLKYLLQHEPADFIRFGLGDPTITIIEPVPSGLPARGRDVDGAYVIRRAHKDPGESVASAAETADADVEGAGAPAENAGDDADGDTLVVHVELHRRHQGLEELAVDIAEAQIRLFRRERRKVLSQVWDLYGNPKAPVLEKRTLWYGDDGSRCVYQRVNLRGLSCDELLSSGPPALWALAPLTRDGATEVVIEKVSEAIEANTGWTSSERADYLAVLWFVAEAEDVPTRIMKAYLSEGRLMESALYKSIFEKGEAKGEARGAARGIAESLIRLLIHRIGVLSPAVRERVRAVSDIEILEAWYQEALIAGDTAATQRVVEKIAATPVPST